MTGMRALLDGLLESQALTLDATRVPREWVDAVLDRDSPFLELAAPSGQVLGIGLVEDVECVVLAGDGAAAGPASRPAAAERNGLPSLHLPSADAAELVLPGPDGYEVLRGPVLPALRHLVPSGPPPPGAVDGPTPDDDGLLDLPADVDWRALMRHIVDGSLLELHGPDANAAWATVCGFPVGIVIDGPDGAFAQQCTRHGVPVISLRGPGHVLAVCRDGAPRLTFAWPDVDGPEPSSGEGIDAVIDPRDTRVALGIALSCSRPR